MIRTFWVFIEVFDKIVTFLFVLSTSRADENQKKWVLESTRMVKYINND